MHYCSAKIELLDPDVLARNNLLIIIRIVARHPIEFDIYKNWVIGPLGDTPPKKNGGQQQWEWNKAVYFR